MAYEGDPRPPGYAAHGGEPLPPQPSPARLGHKIEAIRNNEAFLWLTASIAAVVIVIGAVGALVATDLIWEAHARGLDLSQFLFGNIASHHLHINDPLYKAGGLHPTRHTSGLTFPEIAGGVVGIGGLAVGTILGLRSRHQRHSPLKK